jgi:hypothetical protein
MAQVHLPTDRAQENMARRSHHAATADRDAPRRSSRGPICRRSGGALRLGTLKLARRLAVQGIVDSVRNAGNRDRCRRNPGFPDET